MSSIPSTMRAVRFNVDVPIDDASSFEDIVVPVPSVSGHDILVQVKAVSVNPLDVLLRTSPPFFKAVVTENKHKVLGYDAAGVVVAVGADASLFKVGDEVYYAGTHVRGGTNAEYHVVDERIVGHKPKSLSFTDAAAFPLTTITAYESMSSSPCQIRLIKELTDVTVIATASRPQSSKWVKELGADFIVNHAQDIPSQLKDIGFPQVDYVLAYTELVPYLDTIADVIKPQGKLCSVSPPAPGMTSEKLDKLFTKSVTIVWEVMFTRPLFTTDDIEEQHRLLNHVSELIDAKKVRSIVGENLGLINAVNLKKAHAALESHRVVGKLVLSGF
ncbi:hypothetical protein LEN26_012636 [Aphanomyces euteiches]|nr:hypothetical protein AeMF1_021185 [Aphanomyces euteiches]KAH9117515.1 hypothetical protein LEN26_012636 [Aphanomyces euteiches]KAH9188214.1 hypothetical protein AeNC1_009813 [Aphanomyces euteiches]